MLLNEQEEIQGQRATSHGKQEPSGEPPSYAISTSSIARAPLAGPSRAAVVPSAASRSTASPAPAGSTSSPSMRSNFVQVVTPQRTITSKTVLDLALPQLPNLHPSRSLPGSFTTHDGSRPNLYLSSQLHHVQASLQITDSSVSDAAASPAKRAFVVAESEHGSITIEIESRIPSATLHVCAESKYGNVIIRLPRDFHGPIVCRTNGSQPSPVHVRYTPRVKENMTVLSMHETEAYAFIGDASALQSPTSELPITEKRLPAIPGQERDDAGPSMPSASTSAPGTAAISKWTGDQVEVIANIGRVKICYALLEGEEKEHEGDLDALKRYVQESGPIVAIVKVIARSVSQVIQESKKKRELREQGRHL